jgi:lipase maturation factor 1
MVPLISLSPFPTLLPTPIVCVWGYRWLLFRIMIGAGLIKIRGDQCWRDLTCMNFFYQTQPVPNPLSPFLHSFPSTFHSFETMSNHFIELFVPWMLFMPRICRMACGLLQIFFQIILISAGNLSFLNWLTIAPALMYFDDLFWGQLFTTSSINKALSAEKSFQSASNMQFGKSTWFFKFQIYLRRILALILFVVLANLSIPVINNLLHPNQAMNTSYDAFRIVNTYGAFGSVTKTRTEVILEGSSDDILDANAKWYEFEFKCKPGIIDLTFYLSLIYWRKIMS